MAPRKRARTSSTGGSPSSSATAPTITLSGGEPFPAKFVALWRSGRFTDTVVTVEGRSFVAHKSVLAGGTDYFERHYDHEHMRDADHPKLLEHVTAAAFEPLLAFLYEGACTFDESLLAPVLQAAHFLGVAPLERAAVAAFTERLSPSNALTAWTWGEELELPELAEAAKVTALQGFDEVEMIEEATLAQVQALVADDRLTAKSEEAVFSAVARFAEAKQPAEADLLGLLRYVRFPLMSPSFLHQTVRRSPLLQAPAGQELLWEMMVPVASGLAQQPRQGIGGRFLYVMGGRSEGGTTSVSSVEIYDTQTNSWAAGLPLPAASRSSEALGLGGKMFVTGGITAASGASDAAHVFDPRAGDWTNVSPMMIGRYAHAVGVVGGKFYVFGGSDGRGGRPRHPEAFDPQTNTWTAVAPMPTTRAFMGTAVLDGKIYVVAGSPSVGKSTNVVEVYDPQTNTWATGPLMRTARRSHGVATLGGKIYAAGGYGSNNEHFSSVEAFDPQTNSWADVAPMSTARHSFSLTAARGKLYAVGGKDYSGGILATVEAYDPQQDRWEAVAPLAIARYGAAASCMA